MKLSPWERSRKYGPRKGMDGPIQYPNGRVLYFDRAEQMFYDPSSDYFVSEDEMAILKQMLFDLITSQ